MQTNKPQTPTGEQQMELTANTVKNSNKSLSSTKPAA